MISIVRTGILQGTLSPGINQRSLILHALVAATSVLLSGPEFATMIERGSAVLKALDALCHPEPERRDVVEHLGRRGP